MHSWWLVIIKQQSKRYMLKSKKLLPWMRKQHLGYELIVLGWSTGVSTQVIFSPLRKWLCTINKRLLVWKCGSWIPLWNVKFHSNKSFDYCWAPCAQFCFSWVPAKTTTNIAQLWLVHILSNVLQRQKCGHVMLCRAPFVRMNGCCINLISGYRIYSRPVWTGVKPAAALLAVCAFRKEFNMYLEY